MACGRRCARRSEVTDDLRASARGDDGAARPCDVLPTARMVEHRRAPRPEARAHRSGVAPGAESGAAACRGCVVSAPEPVNDRPILFRGDMVRAILAGSKTQTRRPLAAPVDDVTVGRFNPIVIRRGIEQPGPEVFGAYGDGWHCVAPCVPGDRLWVRETWHVRGIYWSMPIKQSQGAASDAFVYAATPPDGWLGGWRPSIHMPRWASRITLDVLNVRAERVEDISEADAKAEGFEDRAAFLSAWAGIYGAQAWAWVIDFSRGDR
jgi:hypothetical protein